LTGVLGIVLLSQDVILWRFATVHAYALIVFVIIDFLVAALVFVKLTRMSFAAALVWSVIRILLIIGDILVSPMGVAEFADYLLNPIKLSPPNPAGVPGILIDLIVLLEIVVIGLAWTGRKALSRKAP